MFALLPFLCISLVVSHEYSIIDSNIENVILFPNIAKVSRTYSIDSKLCPGYHTLKLMGLLVDLDDASLRIEKTTYNDIDFLDSSILTYKPTNIPTTTTVTKTKEEINNELSLNRAKKEMEELKRKKQRLGIKSTNTKLYVSNTLHQVFHTNNDMKQGTGVGLVPLTTQQAMELLDFEESSLKSIDTELVEIQQRERELQNIIDMLIQEQDFANNAYNNHNNHNANNNANMKLLSISVYISEKGDDSISTSSGTVCNEGMLPQGVHNRITISYYTSVKTPAQWSPQYDIYLEESEPEAKSQSKPKSVNSMTNHYTNTIRMDYYALVSQQTQEDWNDIGLVLSTTEPAYRVLTPPTMLHKSLHYLDDVSMFAKVSAVSSPRHQMRAKSNNAAGGRGRGRTMDSMAMDMDMAEAEVEVEPYMSSVSVSNGGDLGSFYELTLPHPVTINSTGTSGISGVSTSANSPLHRIFIREDRIPTAVFSYAIPSTSTKAYLRAYTPHYEYNTGQSGQFDQNTGQSGHEKGDKSVIPMLSSKNSRLYVNGGFIGKSATAAVAVGSELKLNFGENKRIEITNTYVVPKNSEKGRHNGGSGGSGRFWSDFITIGSDKKLRMHTDEYLFSAKNLHANDHFMVLTENLPQSEEEHVVVEVNSPKAEELIIIEKSMANTNNECLKYILGKHDLLPYSSSSSSSTSGGTTVTATITKIHYELHSYMCSATSDIYWVKWMHPKEEVVVSYKYTTTWPDEKNVEATVRHD